MDCQEKGHFRPAALVGLGFMGISILWSVVNAYVPVLLKEGFDLRVTWIGAIMTIDNVLAVVLLPMIGALSDRTRTRIGRRSPYILVGAPLAALFFAFIPASASTANLTLTMGVIICMNLFAALYRTPALALLPDLVHDKKRSEANAIVNLLGGFGALLVFFVGKPLYDSSPQLLFSAFAVLSATLGLWVVIRVKEPSVPVGSQEPEETIVQSLRLVLSANRAVVFLLAAIFFWFTGFNALETFLTSYAKYHLGMNESSGGLILGAFSLAFLLFAFPAGKLGANWGRQSAIMTGLCVLISSLLVASFLSGQTPLMMAFAVGGAGWALINVNALPMVLGLGGLKREGAATGMYYLASQGANIVAPPLSGLFIEVLGYQALMFFSVIFFCVALVMAYLTKPKNLTPP